MSILDYAIIVFYFVIIIFTGIILQKHASKNIEAYFLGGRGIHWLALSISGSSSMFDITGTMWIVSMLVILGMRAMWAQWMWGVLMGAFFMSYMGKWVRRSNVLTGAEWMSTRFGNDRGGKIARLSYTITAITTLTTFIGTFYQGIGKFAAVYIPLKPSICAMLVMGLTTLYIIFGGLYSVVFTQIIHTFILIASGVLISFVAYTRLKPEILAQNLPMDWTSLIPVWRLDNLTGTVNAQYEFLGALVIIWVLKGLLLNAGGPAQMYDFQIFLASRNQRDASKIGAAWSLFMIIRWGMAAGIALIAITGFSSIVDPEQVMPIVIKDYLPVGIRGFVLAGLLAAFMSTFSATVNSGASYIVRDIWQVYFKPDASETHLVKASYLATCIIVILGISLGFQARSIAQIFNWMMMALGAGVIIPNMLRWYWWRMNGWGYAVGTVVGILFSLVILLFPDAPMYVYAPPIALTSFAGCIIGSYATCQVEDSILIKFYRTIRPFGFWKPIIKQSGLSTEELSTPSERPLLTFVNVLLGMIAISGFYLFPMYLVGHWHKYSVICLAAALASCFVLAFTWYKNLPADK